MPARRLNPIDTPRCKLQSPSAQQQEERLATVPAVRTSRMVWHVRGTWSAREDRVPSAVWLGILWVGMLAGFGSEIRAFAHRNPPVPKVLWVHGAVFTGWMLLLTAQVLLVLRDRVVWHRKLG
jgi:hypothetical protein